MTEILTAVIPVVIIGIICAAVLVVASKIMAVKEDERFPAVRECLPGANCGACGYAGCDGYAKALVEDESTPTNLCTPGGATVAKQLSEALGVEFTEVARQVAVIHCYGDCEHTKDQVDYRGMESCSAANLLFGGKGECIYGCLGMGDCRKVCPQDAICIENGIAHIRQSLCIGCGLCAKTCPNGLISMMTDKVQAVVSCSNIDKGALTRKVCSNGCIGCRKCVKVCPGGAIDVVNNVAVIDGDKCTGCGECAANCTTNCIMMYDENGLHRV